MATKPAKRSTASKSKRHVGDVLGISRATPSLPRKKSTATKRRGVKGIELTRSRRSMKRAGVVGGVRVRGRG